MPDLGEISQLGVMIVYFRLPRRFQHPPENRDDGPGKTGCGDFHPLRQIGAAIPGRADVIVRFRVRKANAAATAAVMTTMPANRSGGESEANPVLTVRESKETAERASPG